MQYILKSGFRSCSKKYNSMSRPIPSLKSREAFIHFVIVSTGVIAHTCHRCSWPCLENNRDSIAPQAKAWEQSPLYHGWIFPERGNTDLDPSRWEKRKNKRGRREHVVNVESTPTNYSRSRQIQNHAPPKKRSITKTWDGVLIHVEDFWYTI